jgi:acyl-CoA reductase-like NAD-dependent aldehyde dehydrogenase
LQLANATNYGLAATVWTNNISKANQIALKVEWNCLGKLLVGS